MLPKNILIIGLGQLTGGPVKSMIQLVEHLNKMHYQIHVLTFSKPHHGTFLELKRIDDIKIVSLNIWINNWLTSTIKTERRTFWNRIKAPLQILRSVYNGVVIANTIRRLKIDLVHTNLELIADAAIGAFLANRKHIWHIRARLGPNGAVSHTFGLRFVCFFINHLSKAIIVNSLDTKSSIEKFIPQEKIHLVYNGITPDFFQSSSSNSLIRTRFSIPETRFIVAAVGYVSYIKGSIEFIEIARRVIQRKPESIFLYIGPAFDGGDELCMKQSNELIKQYHLEKSIVYTGYMNDVNLLLNEVNILVQPMLNGSWSRVVLEGMAAGKPVVAIEESLKSEFIESGKTGLLARDVEECAQNIISLIENPNLMQSLGKAAREFVVNNYSNQKTALKIEEIYRQVLK